MQHPLFSDANTDAPRVTVESRMESIRDTNSAGAPVWLQRLSLFVLVMFCVYLGVIVTVLPWSSRLWDQNAWLATRPGLAAALHTGWVRGLISGLGLLDIWIGISEVMHYRDHRA